MRRIIGKSPNSFSTRENTAPIGWPGDEPGRAARRSRERPHPRAHRLLPDEEPVRLQGGDLERRSLGWRRRHRHPLAGLEALQLGQDRFSARAAEVVQEVVAVSTGAQAADLHEPRPHGFGRRLDRDRARRAGTAPWARDRRAASAPRSPRVSRPSSGATGGTAVPPRTSGCPRGPCGAHGAAAVRWVVYGSGREG
jgi:hypothetical protein